MRRCIVCGYSKQPGQPQLSLFSFPKFLPLKQAWVGIVQSIVAEQVEPIVDKICETHFKPNDIERTGPEPCLKPHAIPITSSLPITTQNTCENQPNPIKDENVVILDTEDENSDTDSAPDTQQQIEHTAPLLLRPMNTPPAVRNNETRVSKTPSRKKTESLLKVMKQRPRPRPKKKPIPAQNKPEDKTTDTILKAVDNKLECLTRNIQEDEFDTFGKHVANQLRRLPLATAIMCQNFISNFLAEERLKLLNGSNRVNLDVSASNVNRNSSGLHKVESVMLQEPSNNRTDDMFECIEEEPKFIIDV